ncbi:MAG TPA: hypothetical protein PLD49_04080, partial [Thermoclostridium caenicola]|nr:hypothetical protein [Thermoclostridium caenicola]
QESADPGCYARPKGVPHGGQGSCGDHPFSSIHNAYPGYIYDSGRTDMITFWKMAIGRFGLMQHQVMTAQRLALELPTLKSAFRMV